MDATMICSVKGKGHKKCLYAPQLPPNLSQADKDKDLFGW